MSQSVYGKRQELHAAFQRSRSSLFLCRERAKMHSFPIGSNTGCPFPVIRLNASESGRPFFPLRLVLLILSVGDDSEIDSSIIESVSVDVVTLEYVSEFEAENSSVKFNDPALSTYALKTSSVAPATQVPHPLTGPTGVIAVHKNVGTEFSMPIENRNGCRLTISRERNDWQRRLLPIVLTGARAITASPDGDTPMVSQERGRTVNASAGNGTLTGHRQTSLSGSVGVTPSAVSAARGYSCTPNYTRTRKGARF